MSFAISDPDRLFHETKYNTVCTFDTNTSQLPSEPSERVQWSINWKGPVEIGRLLIDGTGVAAGHHFFIGTLTERKYLHMIQGVISPTMAIAIRERLCLLSQDLSRSFCLGR